MARARLELKEHIGPEELAKRYRSSSDGIERSHWHILWLYSRYKNADKVAEETAYSAVWVRTVVRRYNELGVEGVGDLRHHNPGGQFLLSEKQMEKLGTALEGESPDKGLWTGPKVAQWMGKQIGRKVSAVTGWKYLVRLDQTLQVPRPRHKDSANPQQQEAFKKSSKAM